MEWSMKERFVSLLILGTCLCSLAFADTATYNCDNGATLSINYMVETVNGDRLIEALALFGTADANGFYLANVNRFEFSLDYNKSVTLTLDSDLSNVAPSGKVLLPGSAAWASCTSLPPTS
jgi:hypothetical protein